MMNTMPDRQCHNVSVPPQPDREQPQRLSATPTRQRAATTSQCHPNQTESSHNVSVPPQPDREQPQRLSATPTRQRAATTSQCHPNQTESSHNVSVPPQPDREQPQRLSATPTRQRAATTSQCHPNQTQELNTYLASAPERPSSSGPTLSSVSCLWRQCQRCQGDRRQSRHCYCLTADWCPTRVLETSVG